MNINPITESPYVPQSDSAPGAPFRDMQSPIEAPSHPDSPHSEPAGPAAALEVPAQPTPAAKLFNPQLNWMLTTGTAGAGKGTLLEHVANTGHIVIPEVARHLLTKRDHEGTLRNPGLNGEIVAVQATWLQNVSEALLTQPDTLPQVFTNIASVGFIESLTTRSANASKNTTLSDSDRETARQLALHVPRMWPLEENLCAAPLPNPTAAAVFATLALSPALCAHLGLDPESTGPSIYAQILVQAEARGAKRYEAFTKLARYQKKAVFSDRSFLDPVSFLSDRNAVATANLSRREDRQQAAASIQPQDPRVAGYTRMIMDAAARFHNIKVLLVEPHAVNADGIAALKKARGYSDDKWHERIRQQELGLNQAYAAFNPTRIAGVDSAGNTVAPQQRARLVLDIAEAFAKPSFKRETTSSEAKQ